jgi:head-tail adaptor
VHCELAPLSGVETQQAQALDSSIRFKLRMYQRADVTAGMRVAWAASWNSSLTYAFEILAVLPDPSRPRVFQLLTLGDID